jgi:hypothetical protein
MFEVAASRRDLVSTVFSATWSRPALPPSICSYTAIRVAIRKRDLTPASAVPRKF